MKKKKFKKKRQICKPKDDITVGASRGTERSSKLPARYKNDFEVYMLINHVENIPTCYKDLDSRPDKMKWLKAIERELESIHKNDTWDVAERPLNGDIIDTKWVFAYKPLETNNELKYKARLVARGFNQSHQFDYGETYAPVARFSTLRILLAIAIENNFYVEQMDVTTAFLNGVVESEIYITPPEGTKFCNSNKVFKLKKALYGLKESAKRWNSAFTQYVSSLNFQQSDNDSCLFYKRSTEGTVYLLLYVDDIILTGDNKNLLTETKKHLQAKFEMKDKGILKHFLGFEIEYDREQGQVAISQKRYIEKLLKKFNMEGVNPKSVPIEPKLQISKQQSVIDYGVPYNELIGSLLYLINSRPDICFAVNYLSQFTNHVTKEAWTHAKNILAYLKGTINQKLTFTRENNFSLNLNADADWGNDINDRKSITGFVIRLGNKTIFWKTKKQHVVSFSTAEAELISLSYGLQELVYIKKLVLDLGIENSRITIYEDNQPCIKMIKNPYDNCRVKHLDIKLKYIAETIKNNNINLVYVSSKTQLADGFTKGLDKKDILLFCKILGLLID